MSTPVLIEHVYNVPVEKVWQAITDKDKMKEWYFSLPEFHPVVGFEFTFTGGPKDGIQYIHQCRITEVEDGRILAHTWSYKGYSGASEVRFELFEEGGKTRLRLTHSGLETSLAAPTLLNKILKQDGVKLLEKTCQTSYPPNNFCRTYGYHILHFSVE